ncbi:Guanine nucleotide-binding protein subunit gamma [Gnomoniopsis smithogilvyi]|uniref:Guanine nucleotide-binding protein subunit gamma n=1 Tax=Gnomoniopsis smithogilvyi TaxID=1191159 RepID=A0A9W8YVC5_9PEZI|nr:Guanine nucleotide-binding protein subunit gamma [Gnomoniopsis smithogilvyi]
MSIPQQDPQVERPRRLIPRSPSHPDLSQGLPPSIDSNASRSEFADNIDRETDTAILADQSDMPQYTSRDVGDPTQIKKNKQSMADLKLRRLTELNNRLREDLERERIPVSQASKSIIAYCNSTRDYMVPSVWGVVPKGEDPYAPQQSSGCCTVM